MNKLHRPPRPLDKLARNFRMGDWWINFVCAVTVGFVIAMVLLDVGI